LAHAQRVAAHPAPPGIAKLHLAEHLLNAAQGQLRSAGHGPQVGQPGPARMERRVLQDCAHRAKRVCQLPVGGPVKIRRTMVGAGKSEKDPQRRRLPRPVAPKQASHPTGACNKAHAVNGERRPVGLRQGLDADHHPPPAGPSRKAGPRKNRVPDMINIAQQPPQADDRAVPGHWEGDLLIDNKNLTAIRTLGERSTGSRCWCTYPTATSPTSVRRRQG